MNYIDILPQIRNNIFYVRIVMTDYDVENQMVIRIVARRNDGLYKTEVVQYTTEKSLFLCLVWLSHWWPK